MMRSLDARQQLLRHMPFGTALAEAWFQPYTHEGVIGTYRIQIHSDPALYKGVFVRYAVAVLDGLG